MIARTPTDARLRDLSFRRAVVLLGVINGYSSREMQEIFCVAKRLIDDDALWWQSKLHAQNRAELTKLAVRLDLFTDEELQFDGSSRNVDSFIERFAAHPPTSLRALAESRRRT